MDTTTPATTPAPAVVLVARRRSDGTAIDWHDMVESLLSGDLHPDDVAVQAVPADPG